MTLPDQGPIPAAPKNDKGKLNDALQIYMEGERERERERESEQDKRLSSRLLVSSRMLV